MQQQPHRLAARGGRGRGPGREQADVVLGGRISSAWTLEVGDAEARQAGLLRADQVAGAAQPQVLLGDAEAVLGLAHDRRAGRARSRRAAARRAGGRSSGRAPRPTRPRSWCSWASPKRSAPSITMIEASGTSTPTSITVVATSSRRRAGGEVGHAPRPCRAAGIWPCTSPTRRAEARARGSRSAPRRRRISATSRFADQRADPIDLRAARRSRGATPSMTSLECGRAGRARSRPAAARAASRRAPRGPCRRRARAARRARDRGRGHHQDVGALALGGEAQALVTPKRCCSSITASARSRERDVLLEQRVGADDDRGSPAARPRACARALGALVAAGEQRRLRRPAGAGEARERREVLAGEDLGRRHHRRLAARLDRASAWRAARPASCRCRRRPAAAGSCGAAAPCRR